jgi:hypothetical protein
LTKNERGNLSEFVKQKPEAKAYYELSSDIVAFNFPEPGLNIIVYIMIIVLTNIENSVIIYCPLKS